MHEKQLHMANAGLYNSPDLHVSKDIFCSSEVKMFESEEWLLPI